MSIFSAIKDAIFGHKTAEAARPAQTSTTTAAPPRNPLPGAGQSASATRASTPGLPARPAAAPPPTPRPGAGQSASAPRASTPGIPASPADAKWEREVDIELVLESMASKNPQQLNWRTSIVDLMKLLGIDSSLQNRKELARELGYTGSTDDSAAMNVWLHKRVMEELQRNGGRVPAPVA